MGMSLLRSIPLPLFTRRAFSASRTAASGHNKWSKIKDKKGINDGKKNAAYTKASRDILTAVRLGGSADPEKNSTLAAILRRLKDIPKENIQNALEKAAKRRELRGEEIIYEALAYNTVGLIIECTTDNPTRTFANIRQILNEHSTRMAPVRFMFERKGIVKVLASKEREDHESHLENLVETALSNGAVDLDEISSTKTEVEMEFTCVPEDLGKLTTALTAPGVSQTLLASEIVFAPMESTVAEDPELPTKIADLVRELEEDEDLKRVWSSL